MSNTHAFCTCCGRQTPWEDLTPVTLRAPHMENLTGAICPACTLDLDGAPRTDGLVHCRPNFHVVVGSTDYQVARR